MAKIASKLIKDGNSIAVRIPKTALAMSGLHDRVELHVSQGQIVIANARTPRQDWTNALLTDKPTRDSDLQDWDSLASEGLNDETI